MGFATKNSLGEGNPVQGVTVKIYDPAGKLLTTVYTDADGYYMFAYKHTAKSATYKVVASYGRWTNTVSVTVKANGFAAVNFEMP